MTYPVNCGDGVKLCRQIEEIIAPLRAHCALTGGCLYRGESDKDIDVIIYSHDAGDPYSKPDILTALASITSGKAPYQTTANYMNKDVVLLESLDGIRIDLFFFP